MIPTWRFYILIAFLISVTISSGFFDAGQLIEFAFSLVATFLLFGIILITAITIAVEMAFLEHYGKNPRLKDYLFKSKYQNPVSNPIPSAHKAEGQGGVRLN